MESAFFGTATIGQKGQLVIPAGARKQMKLKTGDTLLVMSGRHGGTLVLMQPEKVKAFSDHIRSRTEAMLKAVEEAGGE